MPTTIDLNKDHLIKLDQVKTFILSNLANHHTISQLSERFGLNEFKLKTGFRQLYELPPFRFLAMERIQKSCTLLKDTNIPVTDIAKMLGYGYTTNFDAAFKRSMGITPSAYRENMQRTKSDKPS